jgi:hypothetical protein
VPFAFTQGTLVIELSAAGSRLVWHGTYRDDEKDLAKLAEHLPRNVAQLLKEFPPRRSH